MISSSSEPSFTTTCLEAAAFFFGAKSPFSLFHFSGGIQNWVIEGYLDGLVARTCDDQIFSLNQLDGVDIAVVNLTRVNRTVGVHLEVED